VSFGTYCGSASITVIPVSSILVLIAGGESPDKGKIKNQSANLQTNIKIIENLPEAARYLKAFDVFAFPSRKEGLPYALLEAGFAGLPIVASSVGGNLDIIENEKTGLLVPPENPEELKKEKIRLEEEKELKEKIKKDKLEKEKKEKSTPASEWFKVYAADQYSAFDANGLPSHSKDGKELSESNRKKL